MELCEVFWLESTHLHQGHRQRVAHDELCRCAARRGEVQRTSLALHPCADGAGRIFCEERFGVACHGDDRHIHVEHHGYEAQQLVGLPAVADGQHHIARRHHAEVAVEHVERIDEEGWRACAGQCGSNLSAHMSALADTGDDDLSLTVVHQTDGPLEVVGELWYQVERGLRLVLDALYGVILNTIHNA